MSQRKIDKFGLFLGIGAIVAVLFAAMSLYNVYQSTIELEKLMDERNAARKAERVECAIDRLQRETSDE